MIKFKLMFDKDKEITWLNELARQGKAMTGFFAGIYTFENTTPGAWVYQIDFSDHFGRVSKEYRSFMDEMGIEIVQIWGYWVILRKPAAAEGDADSQGFELYTDVDSRITHYTKIRNMLHMATILEGLCCIIEIICAMIVNERLPLILGFVLGILTVIIYHQTVQTNNIVTELMEQNGEENPWQLSRKHVSPIFLFGLILNLCALAIDPETAAPLWHNIKLIVQIFALIFLGAGIFLNKKSWKS